MTTSQRTRAVKTARAVRGLLRGAAWAGEYDPADVARLRLDDELDALVRKTAAKAADDTSEGRYADARRITDMVADSVEAVLTQRAQDGDDTNYQELAQRIRSGHAGHSNSPPRAPWAQR